MLTAHPPTSPRRRLVLAGATVLASGAAGAVWWARRARHQVAPVVEYTVLDGSRHRSDGLRGRVVLINFWATSCSICMAEMPALMATHRQFQPRGFETLAVAMQYDPPARVVDYAQARQLPFPVVIDNTGEIARRFGPLAGTPTSFVLDRRGAIVQRIVGAPDFAQLHALIERLLAEG